MRAVIIHVQITVNESHFRIYVAIFHANIKRFGFQGLQDASKHPSNGFKGRLGFTTVRFAQTLDLFSHGRAGDLQSYSTTSNCYCMASNVGEDLIRIGRFKRRSMISWSSNTITGLVYLKSLYTIHNGWRSTPCCKRREFVKSFCPLWVIDACLLSRYIRSNGRCIFTVDAENEWCKRHSHPCICFFTLKWGNVRFYKSFLRGRWRGGETRN